MEKRWVKIFRGILLGLSLCCISTQAIGGESPLVGQLTRRIIIMLAGSPQQVEPFLAQMLRRPLFFSNAVYPQRSAIAEMCQEFRGKAMRLNDTEALEAIKRIEGFIQPDLTPAGIAEKFGQVLRLYGDPEIVSMLGSPLEKTGDGSLRQMEIGPDDIDVWVAAPEIKSPEGVSSLAPPYGEEVPETTEARIAAFLEAEKMHSDILHRYGLSHQELAEAVASVLAVSHRLIKIHDDAVWAYFRQILKKLEKRAGKLERNNASLRRSLTRYYRKHDLYPQIWEMLKNVGGSEMPSALLDDVIKYAFFRARMGIDELNVVTGEPVHQVTHRLSGLLYENLPPANEGVEEGGQSRKQLRAQEKQREERKKLYSDISRLYAMIEWWIKLARSEAAQEGRSLEETFYGELLRDYKLPRHLLWQRIIRVGIIGTGIAIGAGVIEDRYELFLDIISED